MAQPDFAGQTIDIALAYVVMLHKKPIRLVRAMREYWPFSGEGIYDKALAYRWVVDKLHPRAEWQHAPQEPRNSEFDNGDVKAIRRVLGVVL